MSSTFSIWMSPDWTPWMCEILIQCLLDDVKETQDVRQLKGMNWVQHSWSPGVLNCQLKGHNRIRACRTCSLPVIRYTACLIIWYKEEAGTTDTKTRKLLTMHSEIVTKKQPEAAGKGRRLRIIEQVCRHFGWNNVHKKVIYYSGRSNIRMVKIILRLGRVRLNRMGKGLMSIPVEQKVFCMAKFRGLPPFTGPKLPLQQLWKKQEHWPCHAESSLNIRLSRTEKVVSLGLPYPHQQPFF